MLRRLLIAACIVAVPLGRSQTVFTWTGNSSQAYATAGNWVGSVAPISSNTNTDLLFTGSSANNFVQLPNGTSTVHAVNVSVTDPASDYNLSSLNYGESTLAIGSGGVTATGSSTRNFGFGYGLRLELLANQIWNTGVDVSAYGNIVGAFSLTKTGAGRLTLGGNGNFSGGVTVSSGSLFLTSSSTFDGAVLDGPVGTGTLTLASGTTLANDSYSNVTLDNPIILAGNVTTFGETDNTYDLRLTGSITLNSTTTTLTVRGKTPIQFLGNITQANAGTSVTVNGGGFAVFGGTNTYTGTTTVNGSGLVFMTSGSLPAGTTNIIGQAGAYIGVGFSGGLATVIGKIGSPSTFNGSLGFDTDPGATNPTTFTDALNLTGFNGNSNFDGIGSFSRAIFSGTISVAANQDYKFAGGKGMLFVTSSLAAAGTAGLKVGVATADADERLRVILQGTNAFTGGVAVTAASLIFDSAGAFPSSVPVVLNNNA